MLKPNEVKTVNIATYAVTESKLANNSVITDKMADGAIKTEKIGDKQVTGNKLADRSVTSDKLTDNAITSGKIADGAVTRSKISDGALGRPLVPPIETVEIGAGAVGANQLASRSVTVDKIADNAITNAKIALNTITANRIAANAIGVSELQGSSVTTDKIANQAVTAEKLAPGIGGGDRITFLPMSLEAVYLAGQSGPIDWTTADLSAWIPAGAKAAIVQIGMFTESTTSGARSDMRLRASEEQRESLGVTNKGPSQTDFNFGIVPITAARTLDYNLTVNGTISVTFWITVIGYIV